MKNRILFILKERQYSPSKTSYGLINSATHVADFLSHERYKCKVVTVIDGNGIDKEVSEFNPDIVILEALWCPTYKLKELIELKKYKHIKWIVRVHSDMGFLSCEGQALQLLNEYAALNKKNLTLSVNSEKFVKPLSEALRHDFTYLPNIITIIEDEHGRHHAKEHEDRPEDFLEEKGHIDVGCFGAMRLLKNQCFQALCAIQAANKLNKKLYFHITPNLGEKDPVSTNLIELFKNNRHELVVHPWMPNDEFQELIQKMDIGVQLSFTESFNIVSADFINNNRLIIVSDAIDWISPVMRTSTTDYEAATNKIIYAYKFRNSEWLKDIARHDLREYNQKAKKEWSHFLKKK